MADVHVVTGAGGGIGQAIVQRLVEDGSSVVGVDVDGDALGWMAGLGDGSRVRVVVGDAAAPELAEEAADVAETLGTLRGWVNNAAVFEDASLTGSSPDEVLDLVVRNMRPAVTGCSVAVRRFLAAGYGGSIVNVTSHQAQRPVRGALPYSTAKAAIEGLTRAVAVDHGRQDVRANAVALGSIHTARLESLLTEAPPGIAERISTQLSDLHALGRVGQPTEVAAVIAHLLSDDARLVTGTVIPVDGGRAVLGADPEER